MKLEGIIGRKLEVGVGTCWEGALVNEGFLIAVHRIVLDALLFLRVLVIRRCFLALFLDFAFPFGLLLYDLNYV